jgi:hypothetical protein
VISLKSTSGSILYYRGVPVAWSSKRQSVRATSTCEAEYVAIHDTIKLCAAQGFLDWYIDTEGETVPLVFTDNQSALVLSKSTVVTKKSKHISLRYHIVRDYSQNLCFTPSEQNKADPLSKGLPGHKYLSLFKAHPQEERADVACCHYVCFSGSYKELEVY